MRIGLLLPSILTSDRFGQGRIFAPRFPAVDLANGLTKKGHSVFFYTSSDVKANAKIIGGKPGLSEKELTYYLYRYREALEQKHTVNEILLRDFENDLTLKAYKDAVANKLDIVHSFHDFSAHYFHELTNFPTVYTLHDPLPQTTDTIEYERLKTWKHHHYVSISMSQRKSILQLNFAANIYHGVDIQKYAFVQNAGENLIYIGRLIPDKGATIALQIARACDKELTIGTTSHPANRNDSYVLHEIRPYLDRKRVLKDKHFGDKEKAAVYSTGKAFLFPLQWEEPFGLVMIESMAYGTPVIAFARGSVPEIVVDGETGFLVNPSDDDIRGNFIIKNTGTEGMKEAVRRFYALSDEDYRKMRLACRKRVESHFTASRMVDQYESLYEKTLG